MFVEYFTTNIESLDMKKLALLTIVFFSTAVFPQIMKPQQFSGKVEIPVSFSYLEYLPDGYTTSDNAFPLLIFLHGSGERGDSLDLVKIHGVPKQIEKGDKFPFIVIAPQCKKDEWWRGPELVALLNHLETKYRVDKSRIYVTGMSMGGYGTWAMALEAPQRIAAIVPVCGGGLPHRICEVGGVPTWAFHGDKDNVVPITESEKMINATKKCGVEAKLTVYEGGNHNAWDATYSNPEVYKWLLEHRR